MTGKTSIEWATASWNWRKSSAMDEAKTVALKKLPLALADVYPHCQEEGLEERW